MGDWILPFLEVTALLMVGWCLADAWRRGTGRVLELAAGAAFGLMVEQMAILLSHGAARPDAYRYGPFGWMVTADVPLTVVIGWGAILYAAMKYSDGLGIPAWLRPFADGLYALMIDLTMDVVAVNLGFWRWAVEPGGQWFGVPYSNYGGWLIVATLFSAAARVARRLAARPRGAPAPGRARGPGRAQAPGRAAAPGRALAHAGALAVLVPAGAWAALSLAGRLFTGGERDAFPAGLLAMLATGHLLYGLQWRRGATAAQLAAARAEAGGGSGEHGGGEHGSRRARPRPWPDPARGLPAAWHISYLLAAVLSGVFLDHMSLLFLTGVLAAAGIVLVEGLAPSR